MDSSLERRLKLLLLGLLVMVLGGTLYLYSLSYLREALGVASDWNSPPGQRGKRQHDATREK